MGERNFLYPEISEENPVYGIRQTDLSQEILDSIFKIWQETVGGHTHLYTGFGCDEIARVMLSGEGSFDFRCCSKHGINAKLYVLSSGSTQDWFHVLRFAYLPNSDSEGEDAERIAREFQKKIGSHLLAAGLGVRLK